MAGEERAASGTGEWNDVLEVGKRSRRPTQRRRIERATAGCEQENGRDTGHRLEAASRDVIVRHQVAGQVEKRTEAERHEPGSDRRPGEGSRSDMERDDHEVGLVVTTEAGLSP